MSIKSEKFTLKNLKIKSWLPVKGQHILINSIINTIRATAMYLIDRLALRAGNEKGEDEADTVGCCSLRYEHINLVAPNKIIFDFLGKDSIRYYNEVEVEIQVFKNLNLFKKDPKTTGDPLFDRLNVCLLKGFE